MQATPSNLPALRDRAQIVFNMISDEPAVRAKTNLYMTFRVIERNPRITINQLRWLMRNEYAMDADTLDRIVSSFVSPHMLGCVAKWQFPNKKDVSHLTVRPDHEIAEFRAWLAELEVENPELLAFVPTTFKPKHQHETQE